MIAKGRAGFTHEAYVVEMRVYDIRMAYYVEFNAGYTLMHSEPKRYRLESRKIHLGYFSSYQEAFLTASEWATQEPTRFRSIHAHEIGK